jgi:hypothetical protein
MPADEEASTNELPIEMAIIPNGEGVGRVARLAPISHLSEVYILMACTALDANAFQAHGGAGSGGKHACRGLVAERARGSRVFAGQGECRRAVREPDDAELGCLHAVTRLALAPDLSEVNIVVTSHTRCRGAGELDVEDGRTGQPGNVSLTIDDVALTARYGSVLPFEELRKTAMPVWRDRKTCSGMTRFACRTEVSLVNIFMATDARHP